MDKNDIKRIKLRKYEKDEFNIHGSCKYDRMVLRFYTRGRTKNQTIAKRSDFPCAFPAKAVGLYGTLKIFYRKKETQ